MGKGAKEIDLATVKSPSVPALQRVTGVDAPLELDLAASLSLPAPFSEPLGTRTLLWVSEDFFWVST